MMIGRFFIVLLVSISIISPNTFAQEGAPKVKASASPPQELESKIDTLSSSAASIQKDIDLIKKQNRVFSESIVKVNDENILRGINKIIDTLNYLIYVLSVSFIFLFVILGLIFQRLYGQKIKPDRTEDSTIIEKINSMPKEFVKEINKDRKSQEDILNIPSEIKENLYKKPPELDSGEIKSNYNIPLHPVRQKYELESFIRLYNAGIEDRNARNEFQKRYKPTRFGIVNAEERRRNSGIPAEFKAASDGDYYVVDFEKDGYRSFMAVPRFDMTFQESSYGPGAMGSVFSCPDYNPHLRYRRVNVVRPAIFELNAANRWVLKEKGELNLGQGE
jgi:hypothetical protein